MKEKEKLGKNMSVRKEKPGDGKNALTPKQANSIKDEFKNTMKKLEYVK